MTFELHSIHVKLGTFDLYGESVMNYFYDHRSSIERFFENSIVNDEFFVIYKIISNEHCKFESQV